MIGDGTVRLPHLVFHSPSSECFDVWILTSTSPYPVQLNLPYLNDKKYGQPPYKAGNYKIANGLALSDSFGNGFTFERTTICFSCEMYPFMNPL